MLLKLLERLDRSKYTPVVISLTTVGEIGQRIASLGIPVHGLGMTTVLSSLIGFVRLIWQIRRLRVNIVHTWLYHADLIGGLAAIIAGVTSIFWGIRSSNLDYARTQWMTRVVRRVCALLSHIVPRRIYLNSETASQIHVSLGYAAKKMKVIPNGFDMSRFLPDNRARFQLRTELGCARETLLVGMMGRFDPLKNHAGFFSAMAIVHQHMPQVQLVLAGKGVDRNNEELIQLIEGAGLFANAHLLGQRDDMPKLMAALDVLACPSHAEAFPNVVGEAMASGVPCVTTDVGDCAYIIGDTGHVVQAGDMAGVAWGVAALLELPRAQRSALGEKARARVANYFEIGGVVRKYQETYESMELNLW